MLEQELKFTVADAAVLDEVLGSSLIGSLVEGDTDPPAERFHAVYYDTPDSHLEVLRCSLRARREGMRFRAALKLPGTLVDGLSQREEYEADIDRWPASVADLPGGEFRRRVEELIPADSSLVPRIEVDMLRRVVHLSAGSSQVELVLDEGEIRAGGRQAALCEIELELMRGDVADVLELGAELERAFPLRRSLLSKHAIGISLLGEAHDAD